MKIVKIVLVICILLAGTMAFADSDDSEYSGSFMEKMHNRTPPNTLFGINDLYFSGCGSVVMKYTEFDGTYGVMMGGRGGMIINDTLVIGGGGYGFTRSLKREINGEIYELGIGYGGMFLEYHLFPKSLIHFSIGVLGGVGGLQYWQEGEDDEFDDEDKDYPSDVFWVVEPELNAYINITRFCRLGIGASYRYIDDIDLEGVAEKGFRRMSATLTASFGWF